MSDSPEELRGQLAEVLCREAGLAGETAARLIEGARVDSRYPEVVVEAFVSVGALHPNPEDPIGAVVRLSCLEALPGSSELTDSLDRIRARRVSSLEEVRLARLYALVGLEERAASCFRRVLARDEPLSLGVAVDLAEAAARGGGKPLALAAIDWVAESLLTSDTVSEGPRSEDPVRKDPLSTGSLLQRACAVALEIGYAPRAVALAKAAANVFERVGREDELRRCVETLAHAHRAAGQAKASLNAAKRLRELARRAGSVRDEAVALGLVAKRAEAAKPAEAQALHKEAAKLLSAAGETAGALQHLRLVARLLVRERKLEQGLQILESAVVKATEAGLKTLAMELRQEAVELELDLGRLDRVLKQGDGLRRGWEELDRPERAAHAVVVLARALMLAGDGERARKALGRGTLGVDDWLTAGLCLRVRAELEVMEDRVQDGRCLLVDAARALHEAGDNLRTGEALLRRAELALDLEDSDACKQDLKRCRALAGPLDRGLELRAEVVRARLCADLDEREILLEEANSRASTEGLLFDRSLAAAAKAQHNLRSGEPALAQETLTPVLGELLRLRDSLPEALREGFRRSPLIRAVLVLAADPAIKALGAH